MSLLWTEWR